MVKSSSLENGSPGILILPSLIISAAAVIPAMSIIGLLLIDIGQTFGQPVGVMGQAKSLFMIVGFIIAILIGALSVRFSSKFLLQMGLIFQIISALGSGLALNFFMMLISYSLAGVGYGVIIPMSLSIAAENYPLEKRSSITGTIMAGHILSIVFSNLIIGLIVAYGGWRATFLGYMLPLSLVSFLLVFKGLPSTPHASHSANADANYLEGFREIFSNRSAVAVLIGNLLTIASHQALMVYNASFYRQRFLLSTGSVSIFFTGIALLATLSSFIIGRFVDRFGRKTLTVVVIMIIGVSTVFFPNVPSLLISMFFTSIAWLAGGVRVTSSYSLALEQVPESRGTMMSLFNAADSLGAAIGAASGGIVLLLSDYEFVGITLGAMAIAAAIVYYLFATDPTIELSGVNEEAGQFL